MNPERLETDPLFTPGERRNMIYVRELLLRSSCVDCGDARLVVLEFDHVGTKRGHVTEGARRGCGLQGLQEEIAQCEVRCATAIDDERGSSHR